MQFDNVGKFWIDRPELLFSSIQLIPCVGMDVSEQLNSLSRFVLVLFFVLYLLNFPYSIHFLVISLIVIIIMYYIKKKEMSSKVVENYINPSKRFNKMSITSPQVPSSCNGQMTKIPLFGNYSDSQWSKSQQQPGQWTQNYPNNGYTLPADGLVPYDMSKLADNVVITKNRQKYNQTQFDTGMPVPFCNDVLSIDPPSDAAIGMNQRLTGNMANPKTLIAPIVSPPTHDLEYWRDNPMIVHSHINADPINLDQYLSGYAESTCCDYLPQGSELVPENKMNQRDRQDRQDRPKENYVVRNGGIDAERDQYSISGYQQERKPIVAPKYREDVIYVPTLPFDKKENYTQGKQTDMYNVGGYLEEKRAIVAPKYREDIVYVPTLNQNVEGYEQDNRVKERFEVNKGDALVIENQPGWVNTECGYNAEQIFSAGLPSNLPVGNCQQDPKLKRFNENLFTQIVTPGVYTTNQVNEGINANLGISFQQQFEPTVATRTDKGLFYVQKDPRILEPVNESELCDLKEPYEKAKYDNVYDPRFYGYGTSYRSYLEPVTGQTRFYYNDVNAIKMPNYVTRSKVDHLPYADSYGPIQAGSEFGNVHTPNIRALVQDSFLRDSLAFRNDITERAMRKINSDHWQSRMAPLGPNQLVRRGGRGNR